MSTASVIILIIASFVACIYIESQKQYEKHKRDMVRKAYNKDREKQ